jgi:non-heme chloroperoxidase
LSVDPDAKNAGRNDTIGFTERATEADDRTHLAYKVAGSGPVTLVFMHGWASTKDYFDETIARMNLNGLRVVCMDLRGHGQSVPADHGFAVRQFAEDLLKVTDDAGVDRFIVVGHSMGGKYVQYVQLLAPARVVGQILIAGMSAGLVPIEDGTIASWASWSGSVDAMLDNLDYNTSRDLPDDVAHRWAEAASRISSQVLATTLHMCFRTGFREELGARGRHQPPTLVIAGAHDPFFPPGELTKDVATRIPGSRVVTVDSGHEIPIELPEASAALIEAFVAGLARELG